MTRLVLVLEIDEHRCDLEQEIEEVQIRVARGHRHGEWRNGNSCGHFRVENAAAAQAPAHRPTLVRRAA